MVSTNIIIWSPTTCYESDLGSFCLHLPTFTSYKSTLNPNNDTAENNYTIIYYNDEIFPCDLVGLVGTMRLGEMRVGKVGPYHLNENITNY